MRNKAFGRLSILTIVFVLSLVLMPVMTRAQDNPEVQSAETPTPTEIVEQQTIQEETTEEVVPTDTPTEIIATEVATEVVPTEIVTEVPTQIATEVPTQVTEQATESPTETATEALAGVAGGDEEAPNCSVETVSIDTGRSSFASDGSLFNANVWLNGPAFTVSPEVNLVLEKADFTEQPLTSTSPSFSFDDLCQANNGWSIELPPCGAYNWYLTGDYAFDWPSGQLDLGTCQDEETPTVVPVSGASILTNVYVCILGSDCTTPSSALDGPAVANFTSTGRGGSGSTTESLNLNIANGRATGTYTTEAYGLYLTGCLISPSGGAASGSPGNADGSANCWVYMHTQLDPLGGSGSLAFYLYVDEPDPSPSPDPSASPSPSVTPDPSASPIPSVIPEPTNPPTDGEHNPPPPPTNPPSKSHGDCTCPVATPLPNPDLPNTGGDGFYYSTNQSSSLYQLLAMLCGTAMLVAFAIGIRLYKPKR